MKSLSDAWYPRSTQRETRGQDGAHRGAEKFDIMVVIWSSNVLPSDPSGVYQAISFNDPHKYAFCNYLASAGPIGSVTIVCPSQRSRQQNERIGAVRVNRIPVQARSLPLAVALFNVRASLRVVRFKPHFAYFFDDGKAIPFILPLLASRIRGIPCVLDYRNPPSIREKPALWRIRDRATFIVESAAYKLASLVVALSPSCARMLADGYGGQPLVVQSVTSPAFQRPPSAVFGADGTIRFVYWGSISRPRKLDELLLGFGEACRADPGTVRELVLVGDGDDKTRLEALAESMQNARIVFRPWQTRESLQKILDTASVSVVAIPDDSEQYVASSPLKLAEALALGRPILASDIPATRIIQEKGLGIRTSHDTKHYASAFLAFNRNAIEHFVMNLKAYPGRSSEREPRAAFSPIVSWLVATSLRET